jgi:hypothetical protein
MTAITGILLRGPPLSTEGAANTKQLSLILTYKKTRAFERACTVSQQGAIRPIFEGDTAP